LKNAFTYVEPKVVAPNPDFNGDGTVGFPDFIRFASVFGSRSGDGKFDAKYDLDSSGDIGFPDFLTFAAAFGKPVSSKPVGLSKPVNGQKMGVNKNAHLSLSVLAHDQPNLVQVAVDVKGIVDMMGYSLHLAYDPSVLEPVEAIGPDGSVFQTSEISGVALQITPESGQLILSDVLGSESILQEDGQLVLLTFRVLEPTIEGRLDVIEAMIADDNARLNILGRVFTNGIRPIPKELALDQNYPNPFNPETIIRYQLPEPGDVTLMIYNVLGQQVRTLLQSPKEAGYYQISWDGKNTLGHSVASGVYFYRLLTGDHALTKRMLLIK